MLKVLEAIRLIGKYITIGVCIVAIIYGLQNWVFLVPVYFSFICIGGLLLWLSGIIGVFVYKRWEKRASSNLRSSRNKG